MKAVSNSKEYSDMGWLYRMRRIVGNRSLGYDLAIPSYVLQYRDGVARDLRRARAELAEAVAREKNLREFT